MANGSVEVYRSHEAVRLVLMYTWNVETVATTNLYNIRNTQAKFAAVFEADSSVKNKDGSLSRACLLAAPGLEHRPSREKKQRKKGANRNSLDK